MAKDGLYHSVRIGDEEISGNLFLAPVAGYSDRAFRSICIDFGASLAYTEMASAEALVRGHKATRSIVERAENEKHLAVQLFGANPESLARACEILAPLNPVLFDLNCGCPVPKIVKAGSGSALMRDPGLLCRCVAAMRKATRIPVTIKIRKGWDESNANFLEVSRAAVDEGVSAIALHARTKAQGYSGKADWSAIAELKSSIPVPVFGSGDLFLPEDAFKMLDFTGCDAVMFARGAVGNPFVFSSAKALLEGGEAGSPSWELVARTARRHLELAASAFGEEIACVEFRKQICAYTKGLPGGAELRREAVKASSLDEYESIFGSMEDASLRLS